MKVEHTISEEGRNTGCPLGHKCEECNWYRALYQQNEGGKVTQIWDCSIPNLAELMNASKNRIFGVQQAVESARNENIKREVEDRVLRIVGEDHGLISSQ